MSIVIVYGRNGDVVAGALTYEVDAAGNRGRIQDANVSASSGA